MDPTCHTGAETCYYTSVGDILNNSQVDGSRLALTTLYSLESTKFSSMGGTPSWTKRVLFDDKLLCSKIREEADELCSTLEENEDQSRTISEMADVCCIIPWFYWLGGEYRLKMYLSSQVKVQTIRQKPVNNCLSSGLCSRALLQDVEESNA